MLVQFFLNDIDVRGARKTSVDLSLVDTLVNRPLSRSFALSLSERPGSSFL